jgi:PTS system nitrogen regulatory IIA component
MVMMKDLLRDDLILEDLQAKDKTGVIREFCGLMKSRGRINSEDELFRALVDRESLGSTGIGGGVAIPHGKLDGITDMIVAFGRSSNGVDFQALDNKPVHLFFVLVTPQDKPGDHLKALARISRILKNTVLRDNLMQAREPQVLQRLILDEDLKYPQPRPILRK